MAANVVKGSKLMLFLGGTAIACATSHTLSISIDTTESSTKSKDNHAGAWKTYEASDMSWTVSSENLYSTGGVGKSFEDLYTLKGQAVDIIFTTATETDLDVPEGGWTPKANTGYKGKAIITSLELSAPDGENATFSVNLQGTGALDPVTA